MQPRIRPLCEAIKDKIKNLIELGPLSKTVAIQQSSAVSELKSTDISVIRGQHAYREIAERRAQEHRQNMEILYRHINSALERVLLIAFQTKS